MLPRIENFLLGKSFFKQKKQLLITFRYVLFYVCRFEFVIILVWSPAPSARLQRAFGCGRSGERARGGTESNGLCDRSKQGGRLQRPVLHRHGRAGQAD